MVLGLLDFVPESGALMASIRAGLAAQPAAEGRGQLPPPDPSTAVGRARLRRRLLGWDEKSELLAQIRDAVYAQVAKKFSPYERPMPQVRASVRVVVDLDDIPPGF